MRFTASILLFFLFFNGLFGQSTNLRTIIYSLEDGLSHRLVTRVEKDHLGFVWLATPNGLNRFDGYEFLHFASGLNPPYDISDDYIGELVRVENNHFVITYKNTFTHFDFFDPVSFQSFPIIFSEILGDNGQVLGIHPEKNGKVHFLWRKHSDYFISVVDKYKTTKEIIQLKLEGIELSKNIHLYKRKNGDFFVFDGRLGIYKINQQGFEKVQVEKNTFSLDAPLEINLLKEDQQSRFWLSINKRNGILRFDERSNSFKYFKTPIGNNNIPRIWEDKKGNVIFGHSRPTLHPSYLGFHLLDSLGLWKDVSHFAKLGVYINDLESEDFEKTTLFATVTGFKIAINKSATIKTFFNIPKGEKGSAHITRGMAQIKENKIVVANDEGPWQEIDLVTEVVTIRQPINKANGKPIKLECSRQLFFDPETNYLWGTSCGGKFEESLLIKVNVDTWQAEIFEFSKRINAFCKGKDGLLWLICTNNKKNLELFYFDPTTNEKGVFKSKEGITLMSDALPTFVKQSKKGNLWVGTLQGLYSVDIKNKTIDLYDQEEGLSSDIIETLIELGGDTIMIGTNKGLDIYNTRTKENKHYGKNDGLSANHIYGIIAGTVRGTYWITTINGLTFFNSNTLSFSRFFEEDGLTENEFNRFSFFKDKMDSYYFGGLNGLNVIKEEDLLRAEPASKVRLTKIVHHNNQIKKRVEQIINLSELTNFTLQPYDKYLELFFALPEYIDPNHNQYRIRLNGYDTDWQYLGNKNNVLYSALPAGSFELQIQGASAKGNWSQSSLKINIKVLQVFYKTWQFWLLCLLLLAGGLQLFHEYQLKQKLKVERIRTKLSSDLHDEVSGLLSGIAMQSELLALTTVDEKNKPKLNTISKISRSAMSRMSDVLWSIDSRKDKIKDLITRMSEHAMDILDPLGISWEIDVSNINQEKKMSVLFRENIYFIYKEAINNIGKHSKATQVKIEFGNINQHFELIIADNGILVEKNNKSNKTGQGISNMLMRAQKMGGSLKREFSQGYKVTLTMQPFA